MAGSKDLVINDLSGGYNDTDAPTSLAPNQCVSAVNIDFFKAPCGSRRQGCTPITLPLSLSSKTSITFIYRHLPTSLETDAQLWAFGTTIGTSYQLAYKDTAWHDVAFIDSPTNTGTYPYQIQAQTLHNKLFFAYKSSVDRLHVWDGTTLRASGLLPPALGPVVTNTGAGAYATKRYFRTRETIQAAGVTTLRSEASPITTFTPSGAGAGALITIPTLANSNSTHWEVEASTDNANFYIIATQVVATTTYTDSVVFATGYATNILSETSGNYTVIPSGKFLLADTDRLLTGGSYETDANASIVRWTPVSNDPGVGNDERVPVATNNYLNLDGSDGGGITAMAGPIYNSLFIFKQGRTYRLTRTGTVSAAYDAQVISRTRGAVVGSVVEAVDESGRPALYFLDPKIGPVRFGDGGFPDYQVLLTAGADIFNTWSSVNVDAATVVSRAVFYPTKQQIHWWIATGASSTPNVRIVLQIDCSKAAANGVRKGWAKHDGSSATAVSATLFSTNIEDNTSRSLLQKPFIAVGNTILMLDNSNTDNGTPFTSTIVTSPYIISGSSANRFGVRAGMVIGEANPNAQVKITLLRDFNSEESPPVNLSMAPSGAEDPVVLQADTLRMSEARIIQLKLTDGPDNASDWTIHRIDLVPRLEETD